MQMAVSRALQERNSLDVRKQHDFQQYSLSNTSLKLQYPSLPAADALSFAPQHHAVDRLCSSKHFEFFFHSSSMVG